MKNQNKVALITGAGQGIGLEIARILAEKGHHVIINDIEQSLTDDAVKEVLKTAKGKVLGLSGDSGDLKFIPAMVTFAEKEFGKLDVVIANAVAAELAVKYLRKYRADNKTPVVAFYSNAEVLRLLKDGELLAAATDSPVIQSRIAVDLAVRILQKQPYAKVVSPQIEMLDQSNLTQFDLRRILPPEEQWIIRRSLDDFEHLEESKQ